MKIYLLLFGLFLGDACASFGQALPFATPRQTGLAGLTAPLGDGFSALLCPAAMGMLDVPEAAVAGGQLYGLGGLPSLSAGIAGPVYGDHKAGFGVTRLGQGNLTQTFVAGAYAYSLDKTSLGLQVGYYQLALGDAPTAGAPTVSLSGMTTLIPKLTLAGQVQNINQPKLTQTSTERLPARLQAAAVYTASDELKLLAQIDKTLNRPLGVGVGLEYKVHTYVRLRAGAAPWPGYLGAGVRVDVWGMVLEYGLAHNGVLGQVHSLGIGWVLVPKQQVKSQQETSNP